LPPTEHAAPYVQDELDRQEELNRKRRALGRVDDVSHHNDISADKILKRAKLLVATEISKDPLMRKEIREIFKRSAEVSCYPTDKGLVKIDEHHPYYVSGYFETILIIDQPLGRTSNTFKKSPSQK
jgi:transcription elongation factor SPT6